MKNSRYVNSLGKILYVAGLINKKEKEQLQVFFNFERIYADGSLRNFYRIKRGEKSICIVVYPPDTTKEGLDEARSTRQIGCHLLSV